MRRCAPHLRVNSEINHNMFGDRKPMIASNVNRDWLEHYSRKLRNVSAVTFDVFDTALTRTVETPVDVFAIVEHFLVARHGDLFEGFAELRELSEIDARQEATADGLEDISFEDIYDAFIRRLPKAATFVEEIKEAELNAERSVLIATPEILEAYRIAQTEGKRLCFVSDMYLSSNDIRSFLTLSGFPDDVEVIVSSETRKTKATGNQWPLIKQTLAHDAILHVGDDAHSDGHSPANHGIDSLLIERYRSDRRPGGELTRHILPYSKTKRLASLKQKEQTDAEFMYAFGRSFGVVVVGSFIKWLEERAKKIGIEHIFFLSRDGYLLQKAWQVANCSARTGITESYLYTSRRVLYLAEAAIPTKSGQLNKKSVDYISRDRSLTIRNLLVRSNLINSEQILKECELRLGNLDAPLNDSSDIVFRNILHNNKENVFKTLEPIRKLTELYLRQEKIDRRNCAIADLGWHGSIQVAISNLLKDESDWSLCGFYFGLWPNATQNRIFSGWMEGAYTVDFVPIQQRLGLQNAIAILENLHSSSDGSTIGYFRQNDLIVPRMQDSEMHSHQSKSIIEPFQKGTLDGLRQLFTTGFLDDLTVKDLSIEAGLAAIQRITLSPNKKELNILGNIFHARTFDHCNLSPIIPKITTSDIQETINKNPWWETEWHIGYYISCINQCQNAEKSSIKKHFYGLLDSADLRTKRALS